MTETKINNDVLIELKDMLGDEFRELINTYERDTKSKMTELVKQVNNKNLDATYRLSHSLIGSSSNLGLISFSQLCQEIEAAAVKGDLALIESMIVEAEEEAVFVYLELEKLI